LESALAAQPDETLSLVEAARVSGFTADHLGHLIKTEKIPNYGRKGAPRIKRSDLPLKQPGGRGPKPKLKSVPAVDKIDVRRVAQSFTKERKR